MDAVFSQSVGFVVILFFTESGETVVRFATMVPLSYLIKSSNHLTAYVSEYTGNVNDFLPQSRAQFPNQSIQNSESRPVTVSVFVEILDVNNQGGREGGGG